MNSTLIPSLPAPQLAGLALAFCLGLAAPALAEDNPPQITQQPQSQTIASGSSATLAVFATGTEPLAYQWSRGDTDLVDGDRLAGSRTPTLILANAEVSDAGDYRCYVSNPFGGVYSDVARLTVLRATPPPGLTIAYDEARQEILLFGGRNGNVFTNQTWVWRRDRYVRLSPQHSPPIRLAPGMVFDANRQQVLLFGGQKRVAGPHGDDTWAWTGTDWVELSPTTKPPSRRGQGMMFDSVRQRVVLFGGATDAAGLLDDTWLWDGSDWQQAFPPQSPVPYVYYGMAFQRHLGKGVLFGRMTGNDTWSWDGSHWVEEQPATRPPARYIPGMAYDGARRNTVLFGGQKPDFAYHADTWLWNGTDWAQAQPAVTPAPRHGAAMAYDPISERVVLIGGSDDTTLFTDTWLWDGVNWTEWHAEGPPLVIVQPRDQALSSGTTASFSVTATGTEPLDYQWYRNDQPLPGETGGRLVLADVQPVYAGTYSVRISNTFGSVVSQGANLTVQAAASMPSGLVAWWRGEGNSKDSAGNHDALVNHGATWAAGKVGQGFAFQTAKAHLRIPYEASLLPPTYSVQAWIAPTSQPAENQWAMIFGQRVGRGLQVNRQGDGVSVMMFEKTASGWAALTSVGVIPLNHFAHVAATWDGSAARLYINGTLNAEGGLNGPFQRSSGGFFIGGVQEGGYDDGYFDGRIDEVTLFNRALSAEEIRAIYEAGSAGIFRPGPAFAILAQPQGQKTAVGGSVTFTIEVSGAGPFAYQWRKNGQALDGATGPSLNIAPVAVADGGSYDVVVDGPGGTLTSAPAVLEVDLPLLVLVDNFASRQVFTEASFTGATNNLAATREDGEPRHAGTLGGRSLWMTWRPSQSGRATFGTAGSSFDTLLAVYTGSALDQLVEVASDEDGGPFQTSRVQFNAVAGTDYQIAVDGHLSDPVGIVVLGWSFDPAAPELPVIVEHPTGGLATEGQAVEFRVATATAGASFQWFRDGQAIPGATLDRLALTAQPASVGVYRVLVTAPNGQSVPSKEARLEVLGVVEPGIEVSPTADKFEDLFLDDPAPGGGPGLHGQGGVAAQSASGGWLWVDNTGSSSSPTDPVACNFIGRSTRWFRWRAPYSGWGIEINTEGSEIPATVAVFTNRFNLTSLGCSAAVPGHTPFAKVTLAWVEKGTDYLVMVDGVAGAKGRIKVSWRNLVDDPWPVEIGITNGHFFFRRFAGPGWYRLDSTETTGLKPWGNLLISNVTSGVFQFIDPDPASRTMRTFRLNPESAR